MFLNDSTHGKANVFVIIRDFLVKLYKESIHFAILATSRGMNISMCITSSQIATHTTSIVFATVPIFLACGERHPNTN